MSRMVHEFSFPVEDTDGEALLATDRETSQSNYEHLEYWATGLSAHYLQAALTRAEPPAAGSRAAPALLDEPGPPPDRAPEPAKGRELELRTLDPSLPRTLMKARDLPRGRVRRLKGGALLVYDGAEATEGEPTRHRFVVHAPDRAAAVVAANWIWDRLRDEDAELRIEGRPTPVDPHALVTSLADAD